MGPVSRTHESSIGTATTSMWGPHSARAAAKSTGAATTVTGSWAATAAATAACVAVAARQAGAEARRTVGLDLRRLLALDFDDQATTPLSIVRGAVRYPTAVLREASVPEVQRDEFRVRAFPDDRYDLVPATWR